MWKSWLTSSTFPGTSKDEAKTSIKFELQDKQNKLVFDLKDKRKIDFKQLNSLKIKENLILD